MMRGSWRAFEYRNQILVGEIFDQDPAIIERQIRFIPDPFSDSCQRLKAKYSFQKDAKKVHLQEQAIIRNDISTNAQTLKHNINNVCNLIKLKQAI